MGVTGLVGPLMGQVQSPFVEEVLKRIGGRRPIQEYLDLNYAAMVQEAGGEILLHSWVMEALKRGRRVTGVRVLTKQGILELRAHVVVDATGDGDVAYLAGAAYEMGRPGDRLAQPASIMYRAGGVDSARAWYRVQCIVLAIGAAAGVAVALAARQKLPPRKSSVSQIRQALKGNG